MNDFVRIEFKSSLVMYCTLYYFNKEKVFTSNGCFNRKDLKDIYYVGRIY